MTEDFTLVDFALLAVPPAKVAHALGDLPQSTGAGTARRVPDRPGLLVRASRIWRGRPGGSGHAQALLVQPPGHLPAPPLARLMPDDLGFGAGETPFRITAPFGSAELTLVEFREDDRDISRIAAFLSEAFKGVSVFYFRLSGTQHPGSETAFHIYRDGSAVRRAASISVQGTSPEADWRVVDSGMPDTLEADSLPPIRARAWEVMTPERQGRILEAMGVDPDALFVPDLDRTSVDLSAAPGGLDLYEVWQMFAAAPAQRADPSAAPHDGEEDEVGDGREALSPPTAASAPEAEPHGVEQQAAEAAATVSQAEAPQDTSWDTEVTSILVTAVAHALPEDEQIPWLTHLTTQLEAGNVEEALAEARALIEMGDRPAAERARDAERLSALFGVAP